MKRSATRSSLLLATLLALGAVQAQNNIGVNNSGAAPDASAILDVNTNLTGAATRGMLIPRVVSLASITVNAGTDGMLAYQTGAPAGFYYYNATIPAWVPIQQGKDGWEIYGNTLGVATAPQEFLGTTDNQDMVFRTNNVERMRMDNQGDLGVGVGAPSERLDIGGALRLYSTTARTILGAPVGSNSIYSATDGLGVIEYQRDTVRNAAPSTRRLLWPGHWGNMTGTGVVANNVGTGASSGGWRRLNNDYVEVFNAPYSINGDAVCNTGSTSEIPSPAVVAGPATRSTVLLTPGRTYVTPYEHNGTSRRQRMQFMFLKNELNAELNQANGAFGSPNPTATSGLCPGQPINQIGFYIDTLLSAAIQKNVLYAVTVKHAPVGLNNLSGGFDNSVDPAAGCYNTGAAAILKPTVGNGWDVFNLTTPFVWDGVRNVIVEISYQYSAGTGNRTAPVKFYAVPGSAPANQLTYASGGVLPMVGPGCSNTLNGSYPGYAPCFTGATPGHTGSAMPSTGCGSASATNNRPCIRFGGTVSSVTPFVSGNGPYLQYAGGLVVEDPLNPPPSVPNWGWQTTPYYAFKGPGTVSAQNGVYDNGLQLNDHVFDRAFDGKVRPEDAERFGMQRNLSIEEMSAHIATERHLPTIKGRSDWEREGSFSLGDMANQLWATTETQTLYITELHERLNVLEMLAGDRPLKPAEYEQARPVVAAMEDLTEQQKAALLNDLRGRIVPTTEQR